MFQPRTHENGGPCCTAPLALCDKCKAHFAWGGAPRAASLRAVAQRDGHLSPDPPDPYRDGIERLRRELPSTRWPEPTTTPLDEHGIPDAYAAGLEQMRKEQQR